MSDSVSSVSSSSSNTKLSTANQQALNSTSVPDPQYFQMLVDQFMNNTISTLAKSSSGNSSSGSSVDLNSFLTSNNTESSDTGTSTATSSTNTTSATNSALSSLNQQALGSKTYNAASYQLIGQQYMNSAISNLAKIGISDDDDDNDSSSSSSFDINSLLGTSGSTSSSSSTTADLTAQINKLQSLNTYANLVDPKNPSTATYVDPTTGKDSSGVIEAIKTDKNGNVIFTINGVQVPLSYVQGLTRAQDTEDA